jgi:hypothetical protein
MVKIIAIIMLVVLWFVTLVMICTACSREDVRPQGEKILKVEKFLPKDSTSVVVLVRCGNNLPK